MYYTRLPTAQELESSGLKLEDYEETAEVWPENWPAVEVFLMLGTQWQVGMSGATGLVYPVVFELLDRKQISNEDWWPVFDDIRLMESVALKTMREG